MTILVAVVDDHPFFLTSMSLLINSFPGMRVMLAARDGQDLLDKLQSSTVVPDICLIDVNMPVLNGPATAEKMALMYPGIKLMAMSMEEDESGLISMVRSGCRGWWPKQYSPDTLEGAILEVYQTGYYNGDPVQIAYRRRSDSVFVPQVDLSAVERQLLALYCTPYSEKQIGVLLAAAEGSLYELTSSLYAKLHVRSRIGAVLEAVRPGGVM